MTLYCDSMTALAYAKDPKYHRKTKHIPTNEMVVDPFTKLIARDAFVRHVRSLGLCRM